MSWVAAASALTSAVLSSYGEDAVVRVGNLDTALRGIFSRPTESAKAADWSLHEPHPTVEFDADAFRATGAGPQAIVVDAQGVAYTIIGPPEYDDGGMAKCLLMRAAP